jgi:hypothetical protein
MQLEFGSGALWGERTDLGIASGVGPRQFGIMQDITVDFDWTSKELYGMFQYPVAIGRGQAKISGKVKYAQIQGLLYSDLFFGQPATVGQFGVQTLEPETIPSTTPFQITVAHAASYNDDLGVAYAATGLRFNRVTTPSAAGQYSVNFATGVYTFASADAGLAVLMNYTYAITGSGQQIQITNQLMGIMPTWKATFYTTYSGKGTALRLNACAAQKLSLPTRIDDWTIHELDFMAFADPANVVGYFSTVE